LEECEQYTTCDDLVRHSMATGSLAERSVQGQIEQTAKEEGSDIAGCGPIYR